jgi:broad specificity phosphatase PhoE
MDKITHILCSPLARALETALESFKPLYDRGLQIVAWSQLIETGQGPTNRGDSVSDLKKKMEGLPVDLQYVTEGWEKAPNKSVDGPARARMVASTLHQYCQVASRAGENVDRPDVELLVVSHGTFLRTLIRGRKSDYSLGYTGISLEC